ncbi:MAG: glyoxalase [Bacteroidota bacterium]
MNYKIKSIRTFIGSKDYDLSRNFYLDMGFREHKTSDKMSFFGNGGFGFYLQDYFVKDWVDNSMVFLEVEDTEAHHNMIKSKNLSEKYGIKITEIVENDWGKEFFVYDPSGVLWHIGEFYI